MAGVSVRVDTRELGRLADQTIANLEDAKPDRALFDAIGAALASSTLDRFEDQRGPDGRDWEPSDRVAKHGGLTLVDRGHLRASITHRPSDDFVEVGSNLIYAAIHQFGGEAGRDLAVAFPPRPYLGIDAADEREIGDIVTDHLRQAMQP